MTFDSDAIWRLAIAALGGLAVGVERQWSGHADGPHARFAGLRTFTMLGLVAGLCGWLWDAGVEGPAAVVLAGSGALVVAAYVTASRRDVDGTTEVAAFVVMTAAVLAGAGATRVASGIIAITVLLLVEKSQLHHLVTKIDRAEVRAGARFAVMAAVILPLLPEGPIDWLGGIRPRLLWALVLFFSGLSFVGYAARRAVGGDRGYAIAGTLGGIVSSTSVTLTFARLSREHPEAGRALAAGTLGANTVLFPRVLVAAAILAPSLATALWPAFVAPLLVGAALALRGLAASATPEAEPDRNPLQLFAALQMVVLFQAVLFAVAAAGRWFGDAGLYGSAAVLGLVDMDALTISMARLAAGGTAAETAALAVTIGVLANSGVKLAIALAIGRGTFRPLAAAGLALQAVTLAGAIYWMATRVV